MSQLKIRTYIEGEVLEKNFSDESMTRPITSQVRSEISAAIYAAQIAGTVDDGSVPEIDNRKILKFMRTGVIISRRGYSSAILDTHVATMPTLYVERRGESNKLKHITVKVPSLFIVASEDNYLMSLFSQRQKKIIDANPFTNVFSHRYSIRDNEYSNEDNGRISQIRSLCIGRELTEKYRQITRTIDYDLVNLASELITTNPNEDLAINSVVDIDEIIEVFRNKVKKGEMTIDELIEASNYIDEVEIGLGLNTNSNSSEFQRYHTNILAMHIAYKYMNSNEGERFLENAFTNHSLSRYLVSSKMNLLIRTMKGND